MSAYLGGSVYNDSEVTKEWVENQIQENGPGVFWVTYNVTTLQELQDARDAGKIPVIKYTAQNGNVIYAPINIKGVSGYYTFSSGLSENNDYFLFRLSNSGVWSMSQHSAKDVFICEYGTTTFQQVKDAYDAGLTLYCKAPGVSSSTFGILTYYNNTAFIFVSLTDVNTIVNMYVDSNGWATSNRTLTYDNSLNASSTNAVQNATLYAVIGDVESLLAAL